MRGGSGRLTLGVSPAPVSSFFAHCMTVTFDMRSLSDRKTPLKALSNANCASSQQSLGFSHLHLLSLSLRTDWDSQMGLGFVQMFSFLDQNHVIIRLSGCNTSPAATTLLRSARGWENHYPVTASTCFLKSA